MTTAPQRAILVLPVRLTSRRQLTTDPVNPSDLPWDQIQREWRARELSTLRIAVAALKGGLDIEAVDGLLFPTKAQSDIEASADETLGTAFEKVTDPDNKALLALYVYGLCLQRWEKSAEDYDRIVEVLDALDNVPGEGGAGIIGRHAQYMKHAMRVEQAMNCSCPVAMGDRAHRVLGSFGGEEFAAPKMLDGGLGNAGLRKVVMSDAETTWHYFDAIKRVADAVFDYVRMKDVDFDGVLAMLDGKASALKGDVYESELRTHRAFLKALEAQAREAAAPVPRRPARLCVSRSPSRASPPRRPSRWRDWNGAMANEGLAEAHHSLSPCGPRRRARSRRHLGRHPGYSGASIVLPRSRSRRRRARWTGRTRRTPEGQYPILELTAEVRLSRLGNHHVRVRRASRTQACTRSTRPCDGAAPAWARSR